MTPSILKSLGLYVVWALIGAVVATGLQLATALAGTDEITLRPFLATFLSSFFGSIATILGTSQLARFGSEGLARQVDSLRAQGVPRSQMVVVERDEMTEAVIRRRAEQLRREYPDGPTPLRDASGR